MIVLTYRDIDSLNKKESSGIIKEALGLIESDPCVSLSLAQFLEHSGMSKEEGENYYRTNRRKLMTYIKDGLTIEGLKKLVIDFDWKALGNKALLRQGHLYVPVEKDIKLRINTHSSDYYEFMDPKFFLGWLKNKSVSIQKEDIWDEPKDEKELEEILEKLFRTIDLIVVGE